MSGFRETTQHECINARQCSTDAKAKSQAELAAIKSLPSALEQYRLAGGRVTTLPSCTMAESQEHRLKFLRNYEATKNAKKP
jgi:hypothetical protein